MDASRVLEDLTTLVGVRGAFLYNERAEPISLSLAQGHSEVDVEALGHAAARGLAGLASMHREGAIDLDLVYRDGRFLIRSIQAGSLCIICDKHINLPLLTMTIEQSVRELRARADELGILSGAGSSREKLNVLKKIAQAILGDHAVKVIAILDDAGERDDDLRMAVEQAEKITRLFLDKEKAGELANRMFTALGE